MKNIFSITTPLSTYLQAPDMDFIQAMKLVLATKKHLQEMRVDEMFGNILIDSQSFCMELNLDEKYFNDKRI